MFLQKMAWESNNLFFFFFFGPNSYCLHRQTDRPKPIYPLNFFKVGGIKKQVLED